MLSPAKNFLLFHFHVYSVHTLMCARVCMQVLHVWGCKCANVEAQGGCQELSPLLFQLIEAGSQSSPELTNVTSLASQLALRIRFHLLWLELQTDHHIIP